MLILIGGWVGCFGAAVVASTCLIRVGVPFLKSRAERRGPQPDRLTLPESRGGVFDLASVGFWIGFFETLLIFLFIGLGQPTGLGLILAAKGLARKEEIHKDPGYYLLGFLINITIALSFAIIAQRSPEWWPALLSRWP